MSDAKKKQVETLTRARLKHLENLTPAFFDNLQIEKWSEFKTELIDKITRIITKPYREIWFDNMESDFKVFHDKYSDIAILVYIATMKRNKDGTSEIDKGFMREYFTIYEIIRKWEIQLQKYIVEAKPSIPAIIDDFIISFLSYSPKASNSAIAKNILKVLSKLSGIPGHSLPGLTSVRQKIAFHRKEMEKDEREIEGMTIEEFLKEEKKWQDGLRRIRKMLKKAKPETKPA